MYIPSSFHVDDAAAVRAFMRDFDFATIVTNSVDAGLVATHIPIVVRDSETGTRLVGHVARANPHWRLLDGRSESLVIFEGPYGYVSPTWYEAPQESVPTWNYAVVHAYGRPCAREDDAFNGAVVAELTDHYERRRPGAWTPDALSPAAYQRLLGAIVGFEMPVERCEAKFKLGQNRSVRDRQGTVAGLERDRSPRALELAAFMKAHAF